TFAPVGSTHSSSVTVNGDTTVEPDETFVVNLSNPTNATIAGGQGTGTIVNDDAFTPSLSINNVSQNEGNLGTTAFTFTVTLSPASAQSTVTVQATTANGTATVAGGDYASKTQTLTFAPNGTTQTFTVNVNGDTTVEANETFFVNLSNPTNAAIVVGQGTGTIVNDDAVSTTSADVSVLKTAAQGINSVTYTIVVSNAGPAT